MLHHFAWDGDTAWLAAGVAEPIQPPLAASYALRPDAPVLLLPPADAAAAAAAAAAAVAEGVAHALREPLPPSIVCQLGLEVGGLGCGDRISSWTAGAQQPEGQEAELGARGCRAICLAARFLDAPMHVSITKVGAQGRGGGSAAPSPGQKVRGPAQEQACAQRDCAAARMSLVCSQLLLGAAAAGRRCRWVSPATAGCASRFTLTLIPRVIQPLLVGSLVRGTPLPCCRALRPLLAPTATRSHMDPPWPPCVASATPSVAPSLRLCPLFCHCVCEALTCACCLCA